MDAKDVKDLKDQVDVKAKIAALLADPEKLLQRKPFTRGGDTKFCGVQPNSEAYLGQTVRATLPNYSRVIIPQEQYLKELDPYSHDVLFDDNIPSICVKKSKDGIQEQTFQRTAIPFQRIIKDKKVLHLAGQPMKFTLAEQKPTKEQQRNFVLFKQYWDLRNQDGMKIKMVDAALSYGDAGLLFYFDHKGRIKSRLLSFADGYVICSHNDDNGDRILESVYYKVDETEYIDSYDDTYLYRHTNKGEGWTMETFKHGFSEIPLITKRCKVAWDDAQNLIESYETLYNVFNVIQKKWGWGLLYVKGKLDDKAKKIAGNIVLNDTSLDNANNDAKFLDPPSPKGPIETLDNIHYRIQESSGCTFILPKDIHTSSDTSGISVKLTQSLDIQTAISGIIEWQNVADKMVRLFSEGLSKELVNTGVAPKALVEFKELHINASFDIWEPYSESEYNQMLCTMKNAGILSRKTATEQNTVSRPDEIERLVAQAEEDLQAELDKTRRTAEVQAEVNKLNPKNDGGDNDE